MSKKPKRLPNPRIRAHFNRDKFCLSILHHVYDETRGKWTWKVMEYANQVLLRDVRFIARPSGFNLYQKKKKRTVCAMAEGLPLPVIDLNLEEMSQLRFSLEEQPFFYRVADGSPIWEASVLLLTGTTKGATMYAKEVKAEGTKTKVA